MVLWRHSHLRIFRQRQTDRTNLKLTPLEKFKEGVLGKILGYSNKSDTPTFWEIPFKKVSHFKRSTKIPTNIVDAFHGRGKKDFLRRKIYFGDSKVGNGLKIAENVIGFTVDQEMEIFEHVARQKNG